MAAKKGKQSRATKSSSSPQTSEKLNVTLSGTSTTEIQSARSLFSYDTQKGINLLVLAAVYAVLSQLILAPVYGSIPSATYHKYVLAGSPLLAFSLRHNLPQWAERSLPAFAFWIPTIQYVLFQNTSRLGDFGPLVTELLTTCPLLTLSIYLAIKQVEDVSLPYVGTTEVGPPMLMSLLFTLLQRLFKGVLPSVMGMTLVLTRVGLQILIAMIYGLFLPTSYFWPAIPSVGFTVFGNLHVQLQRTTEVANNTLALYNYTLLERRESNTGYLSVLQDNNLKFRILRCDHSLLGGEWLHPPSPNVNRRVGEPIYAVFTMLEAVRLIEPPKSSPDVPVVSKPDVDKRALNIGLGVGTAPSAMIAHGINTTILELDPVIHELAIKYFNLPQNHSYRIGDAVDFVQSRAHKIASDIENQTQNPSSHSKETQSLQYDYIIHDTFTGGALPIPLFTYTFLTSLSTLLNPTGVIAINYAGDLDLPSAALVYRTIKAVFPKCKIYREDDKDDKEKKKKKKKKSERDDNSNKNNDENNDDEEVVYEGDFTNLVYFCLSPSAPKHHEIKFRKATEADFLGSSARKYYMTPKYELDVDKKFGTNIEVNTPLLLGVRDRKSLALVERDQAVSAKGHWKLMRSIIRDEVWEAW